MAAFLPLGNPSCNIISKAKPSSSLTATSATPPFFLLAPRAFHCFTRGRLTIQSLYGKDEFSFAGRGSSFCTTRRSQLLITRSNSSSKSSGGEDASADQGKTPFGYTRKDVLLIGLGATILGIGLKSGLEFAGVDPLQAGNVVQLVVVLGLTVGWISTYIFRVSNKEMTYAQQLRDYESKVMKKRLEGLTEGELEALLEQVEEEKRRMASRD